MAFGIAMGVFCMLLIFGIVLFNRLVQLRNTIKSAWADIDVELKKRYDLVPNLVETVKGYSVHERTVLENVTAARSAAMKATSLPERAMAETALARTMQGIFAVAEAYPDLKANASYLGLQNELKDIEDTIEHARRYYNAVVRDFNIAVESFPSNLISGLFAFKEAQMFELEHADKEREPVQVAFK